MNYKQASRFLANHPELKDAMLYNIVDGNDLEFIAVIDGIWYDGTWNEQDGLKLELSGAYHKEAKQ